MAVPQVRAELVRRLTRPEGAQEPPHGATVHVAVSKNKDQQEDLTVTLHKVSRLGVIDMQLVAERVEVWPSLVGLAARTVAAEVAGREQVAALGLPLTLAEEVVRLVGAVGLARGEASRAGPPHWFVAR